MRNVTVSLPDEVVRWIKIQAARNDISMSKMLARLITEQKNKDDAYIAAMREFLEKPPTTLKSSNTSYPSRDELHDRDLLR